MIEAIFDVEGNGLLETITEIHQLSFTLREDGKVKGKYRWVGFDKVRDGLRMLEKVDRIVGHNIIGFDLLAIWKVVGWKPPKRVQVVDTLILSCLIHPDIRGGHSLEEWGERVGVRKTDYKAAFIEWKKEQDPEYVYTKDDEWIAWNPVMGDYCDQDVAVNVKVYDRLLEDMKGWDWTAAERMEHAFARYFARQGWRGVMVDRPHVERCIEAWEQEMATIEAEVEPLLPPRKGTLGQLRSVTPPKLQFKKNGQPTAACEAWFDELRKVGDTWYGSKYGVAHKLPTPSDENGERQPLITEFPMKLADQEELKAWLMNVGWVPTMWSYKKEKDKHGKLRVKRGDDGKPVPAQPKFHEKGELCKNLEAINSEFPEVAKVVRWLVVRHRLGFARAVLENIRHDGTVPAKGFALGTPTSRVAHSAPVANVPKAEDTVVYGKECRSMFVARKGRVMVGVDAAGLELRCLAHYTGSPELVKLVLADKDKGELDIHTVLAQGYVKAWPTVTRSSGKNITYGLLYGASDEKVGQTAGAPDHLAAKVGKQCRDVFLKQLPGMEGLMKKVEAAAKRGYVKGLDGRRIEIRSKHAALNTLLQSAGSILVKWATCYMNKRMEEERLDAYQVIHYHDEVQLDCHPAHAERAGNLFIEGLRWSGERFNFRCPLDGEVKLGKNWATTH